MPLLVLQVRQAQLAQVELRAHLALPEQLAKWVQREPLDLPVHLGTREYRAVKELPALQVQLVIPGRTGLQAQQGLPELLVQQVLRDQ